MAQENLGTGTAQTIKDLGVRFLEDRVSLLFALTASIFIALGIFFAWPKNETSNIQVIEETPAAATGEVVTDVSGAVLKPGVYKLPGGSRVSDAISAAGGFSANADSQFVSKALNLAQKITDGAKIYVPQKGETVQGTSMESSSNSISGKININGASQAQLESLPGIGPVTAGKIIGARPYSAIEDLTSKKVVGQKTFEKIKGAISVF